MDAQGNAVGARECNGRVRMQSVHRNAVVVQAMQWEH